MRPLPERIKKALPGLSRFLADPRERKQFGQDFIEALQREIGCEAISIWLPITEPGCLEAVAARGYKEAYLSHKYYLNQDDAFLTSYVGRRGVAINKSDRELKASRDRGELPYSSRCGLYLKGGARNLMAIPLLYSAQVGGVIKFEGKNGTTDRQRFPESDFLFAQALATCMGVGDRQRLRGELWSRWIDVARSVHHKGNDATLQAAAILLTEQIRTECASIFVRSGELLKYAAGIGYTKAYEQQEYSLKGRPDSFTAYVARMGRPVRMWEKDILATIGTPGEIPYKGACAKNIKTGSFRNILSVPIISGDGQCDAVVKLENKLPSHDMFDEVDEWVCEEFAKRELGRLLHHDNVLTPGYLLLVKNLGQPIIPITADRLIKAKELKDKHDVITRKDMFHYCGFTHGEQLARALKKAEKKLAAGPIPVGGEAKSSMPGKRLRREISTGRL
jgi:hypothetical protein